MIEIDGSYGEGGGQILRSAVAVSAITGTPVRIINIRKNRPRAGLSIQHIKSIELVGQMSDAKIEGLSPGSTTITFIPSEIRGGKYSLNIGTAGSISLVLQSITPVASFAPSPVSINVTGGTDVRWSPTIDYFKHVTMPALRMFGFKGTLQLLSRGYFPVGSGSVVIDIEPADLRGAIIDEHRGGPVRGISASSRLPSHVSWRQRDAARKYLESVGLEVGEIELDVRDDLSTGSSITLFSGFHGGSALGERGLPAEKVGTEAAINLANCLESDAAVDPFLCDQLITFMALSKGSSLITTSSVTSHAVTNMWIMEKLTGRRFTVEKNRNIVIQSA
ncbi:putative RNA 3\'-phosphate cyclase [Methanocella arvoryzae MRE50]|uniref:RNA 3'-terminal phosphate cyclase n=2 Tax=Methanocella TaxID=570266 RepID=Q0W2X0_METAR|nr:putative RNA 3\'-phosphate cyclase [Methanocella arvoryzae MRE50]